MQKEEVRNVGEKAANRVSNLMIAKFALKGWPMRTKGDLGRWTDVVRLMMNGGTDRIYGMRSRLGWMCTNEGSIDVGILGQK